MVPTVTKTGWFDYDNCAYRDAGVPGKFDPDEYKSEIFVGGECCLPDPYDDNSFPTRWLWEDFEEEFNDTVLKYKLEEEKASLIQKQNREELKLKKENIWKSVKQKLTKEELKYVCLK